MKVASCDGKPMTGLAADNFTRTEYFGGIGHVNSDETLQTILPLSVSYRQYFTILLDLSWSVTSEPEHFRGQIDAVTGLLASCDRNYTSIQVLGFGGGENATQFCGFGILEQLGIRWRSPTHSYPPSGTSGRVAGETLVASNV